MSLLTTLVSVAPDADAQRRRGGPIEAPTLSAPPVIDGRIQEAEWGVAPTSTFQAPRQAGSSSLRMGYLEPTESLGPQVAIGLVLVDTTDSLDTPSAEQDKVDVYFGWDETDAVGNVIQHKTLEIWVQRNKWWSITGFPQSGPSPSSGFTEASTPAGKFAFALERTASSWVVEMMFEVDAFEAGILNEIEVRQRDGSLQSDTEDPGKYAGLTGGINEDEGNWPNVFKTVEMTGRPSPLQFRIIPSPMEAGVGGELIVRIPFDSTGGTLTVQAKPPGQNSFVPIGSDPFPTPGENRFIFAPVQEGSWGLQAVWEGDTKYARVVTAEVKVQVNRPIPGGVTVLEHGAIRMAFSPDYVGSPAEWRYMNHLARASTDGAGNNPLELVELHEGNSCRRTPWTGIANLADGNQDTPLVIHFDPPVRRAAVALTSPNGNFEVNLKAFQADGLLKVETNSAGSCSKPVFASLGDADDNVERVEIVYTGDDVREVVDVLFGIPLPSPHALVPVGLGVSVLTTPSTPHPDGQALFNVSASSPHRLTETTVRVNHGSAVVATKTCFPLRGEASLWIDCAFTVDVPDNANSLTVSVTGRTVFGDSVVATRNVRVQGDDVPPLASLLPKPLIPAPGANVAVTARAEDASGLDNIVVQAVDQDGELIKERTCEATQLTWEYTCVLAVSPPATGQAWVTATFEDNAGNTKTLGPKPLAVRGTDGDSDGLPDALELTLGTDPGSADTDGDGLSDAWEVLGVDRDGDGEAELDLAALGADPQVRDIFMEVDWAAHETHSHEPAYGALQAVRNILSSRGIRLHVDSVHHGGPFDPLRFDHGHAAHRHLIDDARAGIFMHLVAGHMGGPAAGAGRTIYLPTAETDDQVPGRVGAQILHEVGHLLEIGHGGGGENEDTPRRGAPTTPRAMYSEDFKPNYLSVVNNAYAWGLVVDTIHGPVRVPTFAGVTMEDLIENELDEAAGLNVNLNAFESSLRAGPTPILEVDTLTGVRVRYSCPGQDLVRWVAVPGAVDWNCNGDPTEGPVEVDLNRGGANVGIGTLVSRADWEVLSFRGSTCPHFGLALADVDDTPAGDANHGTAYQSLGLAPCPVQPEPAANPDPSAGRRRRSLPEADSPNEPVEEANGEDDTGDGRDDGGYADDDGDGVVNLIDDCPRVVDSGQRDEDRDGRGDRCQAVPGAVQGLNATLDPASGVVSVEWDAVADVWGYNIYRVTNSTVRRLESAKFPSTTQSFYEDLSGSPGARYVIKAVSDLGDQGIGTSTPVWTGPPGGGENGGEPEGVPSIGALLTLVLVGLGALVRRRR